MLTSGANPLELNTLITLQVSGTDSAGEAGPVDMSQAGASVLVEDAAGVERWRGTLGFGVTLGQEAGEIVAHLPFGIVIEPGPIAFEIDPAGSHILAKIRLADGEAA